MQKAFFQMFFLYNWAVKLLCKQTGKVYTPEKTCLFLSFHSSKSYFDLVRSTFSLLPKTSWKYEGKNWRKTQVLQLRDVNKPCAFALVLTWQVILV